MKKTRREFLRNTACGLTAAAVVNSLDRLSIVNAMVQQQQPEVASDYKALVCVFLSGGSDCNNMVVPVDAEYASYNTVRGPSGLAISQQALVPIPGRQQNNYEDALKVRDIDRPDGVGTARAAARVKLLEEMSDDFLEQHKHAWLEFGMAAAQRHAGRPDGRAARRGSRLRRSPRTPAPGRRARAGCSSRATRAPGARRRAPARRGRGGRGLGASGREAETVGESRGPPFLPYLNLT